MKKHVIRNGAAGLIGAALVLSGCFGQGQGEDIGLHGQGQEQSAGMENGGTRGSGAENDT